MYTYTCNWLYLFTVFAWEANEKGSEVNLQADPTKLDLLTKEYQNKKEDYKVSLKESILEKYGGQEHLDAPPKQLLLAQTVSVLLYCTVVLLLLKHIVHAPYWCLFAVELNRKCGYSVPCFM